MATPAQIANDMTAQAAFWHRRDDAISDCCRECAHLIRMHLDEKQVDGRTCQGLVMKMEKLLASAECKPSVCMSMRRGLECLRSLNAEASRRNIQARVR